jgi:hypothetical protein
MNDTFDLMVAIDEIDSASADKVAVAHHTPFIMRVMYVSGKVVLITFGGQIFSTDNLPAFSQTEPYLVKIDGAVRLLGYTDEADEPISYSFHRIVPSAPITDTDD